MQSAESNRFVADGYERAQEGIRAQVKSEYAKRLKTASPEEAVRLRQEMVRETDDRVRRLAKPDSHF
jgi:hypothetical protein